MTCDDIANKHVETDDPNHRRSPSDRTRIRSSNFFGWTLVALQATMGASLFAATHYVTPFGSAAPESDDPARPWHMVESAVHALPKFQGGTVSVAPGVYREALTLDVPVFLTAPSGVATIGAPNDVVSSTSFRVLTWTWC